MRRTWVVVALAVVLGAAGVWLSPDDRERTPAVPVAASRVLAMPVLRAEVRPDPRYLVVGYVDDDGDGELVGVDVGETSSEVRLTVHVRVPSRTTRPGVGVGRLSYTTVALAAPLGTRRIVDTFGGGRTVVVRQSVRAENVSHASSVAAR